MYIPRGIAKSILVDLENAPVVALLGARQTGKSTLVKHLLEQRNDCMYLDLERPSNLAKLEDAELFFTSQKDKLICIDEIQRKPELFPLLRSLTDEWGRNGTFLVLGSASRDLLRQSSETLAGRIAYQKLTPFLWNEIKEAYSLEQYITKGGFPRSLITTSDEISLRWREDFIATFLERDLLQWRGFTTPAMRRLWTMLAHFNGQTTDYSALSKSLGISNVTVKHYIDLLEETFMLKTVPPYFSNFGKRLVKSSKIYLNDSGMTTALLGLGSYESILGHPSFGSLWEQIVLSNLHGVFPEAEFYFYRTTNGAEIDFVMKIRNRIFAIECKTSLSPSMSTGNYRAIEDISPEKTYVVSPVKEGQGWIMKNNIELISLSELPNITGKG